MLIYTHNMYVYRQTDRQTDRVMLIDDYIYTDMHAE
jgi:hypothetical protein